MATDFPADVVKTTHQFASELEQFNRVNVDDIAQLWKVYTTQGTVAQDVVVSRLENLFWRIWGNGALQQSLTGITLATIFMAIHETPSFHVSRHRQSLSELPTAVPLSATCDRADATLTITTITPNSDDERKESLPKKESKGPLPPILKKPNDGKSQPPTAPSSYKTTRILIPEKPSQRAAKSTNAENGKSTKSANTSAAVPQKSSRKKTTFVANRGTSTRRRGVLIRRKSAQTSPITSPAAERSEESLFEELVKENDQKENQREGEEDDEGTTAAGPITPAKDSEISWQSLSYLKNFDEANNRPRGHEPSGSGTSPPPTNFSFSSVHHHRSPEEFHTTNQGATRIPENSDKPLVDKDFRSQFAQRARQASTHGTTNNSTASSLTTRLSSTNFRELLNAAEAAASMKTVNECRSLNDSISSESHNLHPSQQDPISSLAKELSLKRNLDSKDRNLPPFIIGASKNTENQHANTETVARHSSPATVSKSVTSTSQLKTSGVFSLPKELQDQLGEQLNSLIER